MNPDSNFSWLHDPPYYMNEYGFPQKKHVPTVKCASLFWDGSVLHSCSDTQGHIEHYHLSQIDGYQWENEESCCGFQFNDNSKQGICVAKQGLKAHLDPSQLHNSKLLIRHQMLDVKNFLLFEAFEAHQFSVSKQMLATQFIPTPNDAARQQAQQLLDTNTLPPHAQQILEDLLK